MYGATLPRTSAPDRAAAASSIAATVDVDGLQAELARRVDGEVRFDPGSIAAYSTDASNYRFPPIGVVVPKTVEAGVEALAVCRRHDAAVLSRGGGTSLAGQSTNAAVVVDWSKHCTALLSVDRAARTCVVEPGIKLDQLNAALAEHQLIWGPQPATHWSCTVGGMLGNNSCGAAAQTYGKAVDNVYRLEVLLYDGTRMWVGPTTDEEYAEIARGGDRKAEVYRALRALRDRHLAAIRTRYPDIPRRVSGYNLDSLLPERSFDVARALVGSEGTLVTILAAELRLNPAPGPAALVMLGYPDSTAAARAVPDLLAFKPHRLEGFDDILVRDQRGSRLHVPDLDALPRGTGWLMVELVAADRQQAVQLARELLDHVRSAEHAPAGGQVIDDPAQQQRLWEVREAGLGVSARPAVGPLAWPGWEDSAVAPERLGDYLRDLRSLLDRYGYHTAALYGHFGQGCVHTRIPFELRTEEGVAAMRAFVTEAADLVCRYGGSLSGEHGDGQARGELLARMFGAEMVQAFEETKAIFDPADRMSPGKVVAPYALDADLRLGADYAPWPAKTAFAFPDDHGSFSAAALRCVGVGKCRNSGSTATVMCPSYQATGEEEHSTRGRARLLFEMLRGEVITDRWRSTRVRDALDLCLACKGCKSDCPVNVDMATYKAEFLHHHYAGRVRPAAHYSMGWLPIAARAAALAPRLVNSITGQPRLAALAKRLGGIAPERTIPRFAERRFSRWYAERGPRGDGHRGEVLLWPDTFTEFLQPQVGRAAVEVLEAAGFTVRLPERELCCGLTWISTGQLDVAKRVLRRSVDALAADVRAGVPVVTLEPSCTAVFRSDGLELFPHDEDVRRLQQATSTLAEFLDGPAASWSPPPMQRKAVMQTHCHQHAVLGGADPDLRVLQRAGVDAEALPPSCCGLAGNFGFERGHYGVSMACAERVLLPAVRAADQQTLVVADGFSCRTQLEQSGVGRSGQHLAEVLAAAIAVRR
jgi:FAD/FMN-containing dehydrogenase/Fe-S oxidoreductase